MGNIIWLVATACAVWVIYDVWSKNKRLTDTEKLIWTLSAIVFSVITAVIYYFTQKNKPL